MEMSTPKKLIDPSRKLTLEDKLLWWLLRYPLQRAEDLSVAFEVSFPTIYRVLSRFEQDGLIETVTPSLGIRSTCRWYYLTTQGLLAAARDEQTGVKELARSFRATEQGILSMLPRLAAFLRLHDLVSGLLAQAPSALAHPGGYRAELGWNWIRDYQHTFRYRGREHTLSADAALLLYRSPNARLPNASEKSADFYSAFLFLDPGFIGHDDPRLITKKLENMISFRESPERGRVYQQFPPVVILAPTERQKEIWQQCASELEARLRSAPLIAAIGAVSPDAPLSSPWTLSWQTLSSRSSCRLRDLFAPLPRDAVPPHLLPSPQAQGHKKGTKKAQTAPSGYLIRGHFSQRARNVSLLPLKGAREHEAVALLSLHLSYRYIDVLSFLYAHPLQNLEDLATFLNLRPPSMLRYLSELRRYHCADQFTSSAGPKWYVTERGLRLLAARHHYAFRHIAERNVSPDTPHFGAVVQRGALKLQSTIHHTSGIYRFFARLQQTARAQDPEHTLLWWETGFRCERRYRDHGAWHNLRPDAAFAYRSPAHLLHGWLEWDEGSMKAKDLSEKMSSYAHYIQVREWAVTGARTLPILFIVVPDKWQSQRMEQAIHDALENTKLVVRITLAAHLKTYGPLAQIWQPVSLTGERNPPQRVGFLDLH